MVGISFGKKKFTGRYVKKRDTAKVRLCKIYGSKEIVFLVVKDIVVY